MRPSTVAIASVVNTDARARLHEAARVCLLNGRARHQAVLLHRRCLLPSASAGTAHAGDSLAALSLSLLPLWRRSTCARRCVHMRACLTLSTTHFASCQSARVHGGHL